MKTNVNNALVMFKVVFGVFHVTNKNVWIYLRKYWLLCGGINFILAVTFLHSGEFSVPGIQSEVQKQIVVDKNSI